MLRPSPEVLVLHEGPDEPSTERRGSPAIRAELEAREELLVICGHSHWDEPLAELSGGAQVLNVDGRAVLLRRGS
ncbi:metallophosphoesterase family protein [Archangium lansingense]|uniref:Metallophosphoesterase family protein n=1 Tax=Archangium lansingense TaxID=2995310 RepID=A0ABT4ABG3_9BACT|nr:metallophosphoesterase family protein [Archangium lansinium]MCY1079020.1 metallophosphoesterase family protein [Archangium lansinium]